MVKIKLGKQLKGSSKNFPIYGNTFLSSHAGEVKSQLYKQLCDAVEQTPVGDLLVEVGPCDYEDFYKKYLHDFVRIVHRSTTQDCGQEIQEYEVKTLQILIGN